MYKAELLKNIDNLHTTDLGVLRIKRNLDVYVEDIVSYCKEKIKNQHAEIERVGKNYYITIDNIRITVNAHSYTIITAHKLKKDKTGGHYA